MSDLKAPNGKLIIGTLETVPGTALIQNAKVKCGKVEFEYEGETKIDWDSQKSVLEGGQRVFVDEEWNTWTENKIVAANKG